MTQKSQFSNGERVAVFPGSFDPFTIGHYSIVERALEMFDRVVVAIGINDGKQPMFSAEARCDMVRQAFAGQPRVSAVSYTGLTVDVAHEVGACAIVRGVRTVQDFEFERNLADINRRISGIETVLLYTLPEHSCISSSVVRELLRYDRDVSDLLPAGNKLP